MLTALIYNPDIINWHVANKHGLEFQKCIIVMFQLARDFIHLASKLIFLFATCADSEPLRKNNFGLVSSYLEKLSSRYLLL